jgi:acid stress-induced BolA-like protein IbaG/YrbA
MVASLARPAVAVATARTAGRWLAPSVFRPQLASLARMSSSASGGGEAPIPMQCRSKIQAGLNAEEVQVEAAYDDPNGSHIAIYCVATAFEGKSAMQRQQLVYKQIWSELQGPVHAVDKMVLKTPAELAAGK